MRKLCDLIYVVLAVIGAVTVALIAVDFVASTQKYQRINCSVSEIHPDFTKEMRQACRQLKKVQS